jgi:hypothetical protein
MCLDEIRTVDEVLSESYRRFAMRNLEKIEQIIRGLSASEFAELKEWFLEQDWAAWDRQIESDEAAGKLEYMVSEAKAEFDRGNISSKGVAALSPLGGSAMSTAKEELTRLIESQPADASREEIVRELAFHVMVERGIADSDAKRVISDDEMARRIRAWRK